MSLFHISYKGCGDCAGVGREEGGGIAGVGRRETSNSVEFIICLL